MVPEFTKEELEYWNPVTVTEPQMPQGAVTMALLANEQTGVLDLVMLDSGGGTVLASVSEGPGGWHVTGSSGVYLTAGPKRTLEAALVAAVNDGKIARQLICEMTVCTDDVDTIDMEVRCG